MEPSARGLTALLPTARRALRYVAPVAVLMMLGLARFRFDPVMSLPIYSLLAISCAAVLPFAVLTGDYPKLGRVLCSRFLRTFGKYSYGIYVLHPFVIDQANAFAKSAAFQHVAGTSYEAYVVARMVLGVGGAFALAFLSWHLYEKHFLRLKAFFPSGRVSSVAASPTTNAAPAIPAAVPSP